MKNENFVELSQYTVTIPNLTGRLSKITDLFARESINITNLTVTPVGDYSLVRFTVAAGTKLVDKILSNADYSFFIDTVYSMTLPNNPGVLNKLIKNIASAGYNINTVNATSIPGSEFVNIIILPSKYNTTGSTTVSIREVFERQVGRVPVA